MQYSRDYNGEFHLIQVVEADSPEEAAKLFKDDMQMASEKAYNNKWLPDEIRHTGDVDYLPEQWNSKITFFSDEDCTEYDADGKEIPFLDIDEDCGGTHTFVWGQKSFHDLTGNEPNLFTLNDIEVTYHNSKYYLGFEEAYCFDTEQDKMAYLDALANELRIFVLSQGYSEQEVDNAQSCTSFSKYYPHSVMGDIVELSHETLLGLYHKFKLFIAAYKAVCTVSNASESTTV